MPSTWIEYMKAHPPDYITLGIMISCLAIMLWTAIIECREDDPNRNTIKKKIGIVDQRTSLIVRPLAVMKKAHKLSLTTSEYRVVQDEMKAEVLRWNHDAANNTGHDNGTRPDEWDDTSENAFLEPGFAYSTTKTTVADTPEYAIRGSARQGTEKAVDSSARKVTPKSPLKNQPEKAANKKPQKEPVAKTERSKKSARSDKDMDENSSRKDGNLKKRKLGTLSARQVNYSAGQSPFLDLPEVPGLALFPVYPSESENMTPVKTKMATKPPEEVEGINIQEPEELEVEDEKQPTTRSFNKQHINYPHGEEEEPQPQQIVVTAVKPDFEEQATSRKKKVPRLIYASNGSFLSLFLKAKLKNN